MTKLLVDPSTQRVLGAGLVSRPLVQYLLGQKDYHVTVASRTVSKAEALVGDHERGTALPLNVKDHSALEKLVAENDLSISLLPYTYHVRVAKMCIRHGKHMVTTSYISDEMKALDAEAKAAGITSLPALSSPAGTGSMSSTAAPRTTASSDRTMTICSMAATATTSSKRVPVPTR